MTKTIISTIGDRKLKVLWTWPQNNDLRIVSVRDYVSNDKVSISDQDFQLIYEDICDNIN